MVENERTNNERVMEKEYYEELKQTIERHMDLYYNQNTNEAIIHYVFTYRWRNPRSCNSGAFCPFGFE